MVKCEACGKVLRLVEAIIFERALDGATLKESKLVKAGFSCPDIECLCEATGVTDEVKRERGET